MENEEVFSFGLYLHVNVARLQAFSLHMLLGGDVWCVSVCASVCVSISGIAKW